MYRHTTLFLARRWQEAKLVGLETIRVEAIAQLQIVDYIQTACFDAIPGIVVPSSCPCSAACDPEVAPKAKGNMSLSQR